MTGHPRTPSTAAVAIFWVGVAIIGLMVGGLWAWGWGLARSIEAPPGWGKVQAEVPYRSPAVVGDLALSPWRWSLDHHEALTAPAVLVEPLLKVRLQDGARLELHAPPGQGLLVLETDDDRASVAMMAGERGPRNLVLGNSQESSQVEPSDGTGALTLLSGSRRVQVTGIGGRPLGVGVLAAAMAVGMVTLLAVVGIARGLLGCNQGAVLFCCCCLMAGWPALRHDPAELAASFRMQWLDHPWLALGIGLTSAWSLSVTILAGAGLRMADAPRWRPPLTLAGLVLAVLVWALAVGCRSPGALGFTAGAATCGGVLLWANVNASQLRAFNWIALGAAVSALLCIEGSLHFSTTGQGWEQAYRWSRGWIEQPVQDAEAMANRDFVDLERGEHSTYPGRGYPVAYPSRSTPTRVVVFGGSSTGGAFVNDSLDDFFPARLEALLGPEVEVLNQGVGGWTTFHIHQYAAQHLEALEPDLVVLYTGNNDSARVMTLSYEQQHARWKGRRRIDTVAGPLRRSRSYRGLASMMLGFLPGQPSPAVLPSEAEANIAAIAELCRQQGADLLLVAEGHDNASAGPLAPYHSLMSALAATRDDVHSLDGHGLLQRAGAGMFIDAVHLSDAGHSALARALAAEILRRGLVPTPAPSDNGAPP